MTTNLLSITLEQQGVLRSDVSNLILSVGTGFPSNQSEAKSESTESPAQLITQVESGVAHAWQE